MIGLIIGLYYFWDLWGKYQKDLSEIRKKTNATNIEFYDLSTNFTWAIALLFSIIINFILNFPYLIIIPLDYSIGSLINKCTKSRPKKNLVAVTSLVPFNFKVYKNLNHFN